jgi:hypothetical protein
MNLEHHSDRKGMTGTQGSKVFQLLCWCFDAFCRSWHAQFPASCPLSASRIVNPFAVITIDQINDLSVVLTNAMVYASHRLLSTITDLNSELSELSALSRAQ